MSTIFPDANTLRTQGPIQTTILTETNAMEVEILAASNAGMLMVVIDDTTMTNPTLPSFTDITSVDGTTSTFTLAASGLVLADEIQLNTTTTLPAPLTSGISYFVIPVDSNTFKLATTQSNAMLGVAITLTSAGSGTQQFRKVTQAQKFYATWQGTRIDRVRTLQMNTVIQNFTDLGYSISRIQNPTVPSVFSWNILW